MSEFIPVLNEFIPWTPWNEPVTRSRVALVSTGGVYLKNGLHQPFEPVGDASFREFPSVVDTPDLDLAHGGIDPQYAREDMNVLFPLQRLKELAEGGYISGVAPFAYSFMGQVSDPVALLANYAPSVAWRLRRMGAEVALVVAVGGREDHQMAGLVARAIELAGVPTVVLGLDKGALEAVGVPRGVVVKHPVGAPLGNPGNAGKHQYLLRSALDAAWELEGPGLVLELPFAWAG
ncbi:MAG TPA: glycine/sarcosine/betaine reductase selenoprotein B family protein [Symbiobacteriaceae bacterium]|jgi:D-proline reductase (dithiol) PrdB|nr:glycine/sarcosine/betaine reductase selenoprotein B family protein [Symbiobacteriaceae bacterium]